MDAMFQGQIRVSQLLIAIPLRTIGIGVAAFSGVCSAQMLECTNRSYQSSKFRRALLCRHVGWWVCPWARHLGLPDRPGPALGPGPVGMGPGFGAGCAMPPTDARRGSEPYQPGNILALIRSDEGRSNNKKKQHCLREAV